MLERHVHVQHRTQRPCCSEHVTALQLLVGADRQAPTWRGRKLTWRHNPKKEVKSLASEMHTWYTNQDPWTQLHLLPAGCTWTLEMSTLSLQISKCLGLDIFYYLDYFQYMISYQLPKCGGDGSSSPHTVTTGTWHPKLLYWQQSSAFLRGSEQSSYYDRNILT